MFNSLPREIIIRLLIFIFCLLYYFKGLVILLQAFKISENVQSKPMILNANKKEIRKGILSLNSQCYFQNVSVKMLFHMKMQPIYLG